jgi:hypothetical protein
MSFQRLERIVALGFLKAGLLLFPCDGIASGNGNKPSGNIQLIDQKLCNDMRRHHVLNHVFPKCDRLRLVTFSYINFGGETKADGQAVVLDAVANHVLMLFNDLRLAKFPIEKANLMNTYEGNDDLSMDSNNTSSFNDRNIAGSRRISLHAYGAAIDINPRMNPFIAGRGRKRIVKPASGAANLDRAAESPGMAEPVRAIFFNHGFLIWGGDWRNPVDYQHFQISRDLAERLTRLPEEKAFEYFERYVQTYRACIGKDTDPYSTTAIKCRGQLTN